MSSRLKILIPYMQHPCACRAELYYAKHFCTTSQSKVIGGCDGLVERLLPIQPKKTISGDERAKPHGSVQPMQLVGKKNAKAKCSYCEERSTCILLHTSWVEFTQVGIYSGAPTVLHSARCVFPIVYSTELL